MSDLMAVIEHAVEGVFTIMRSESSHDCSCCEGHHVFAYGVDLPGEPASPGARGPRMARPQDWLDAVLYQHREHIDGAKVRITVTVEHPITGDMSR